MRKLFKKSLACCLALALLLSAAVTTLANTTETTTAQAAVSVSLEISEDRTTATATVDITSDDGIAAIFLNATSDFGTLTDVELTDNGTYTETVDGVDYTCPGFHLFDDAEGGSGFDAASGNIILLGQSTNDNVKSAKLTLTYTAEAAVADGTYTVTIAPAADVSIATWDEAAATFTTATGKAVVASAPSCDHAEATYTDKKDGTHDVACDCGYTANEAHSYTNAVCACGAKFIDESLVFADLGGAIGSTPYFDIGFEANKYTAYADFDLIASRVTNDDSFNFKEITEVVHRDDTYYPWIMWQYNTVELYSLTVPVTFQIRCYDEDGNIAAYSNEFTYTLKEILANTYNKSTTTTQLKTVITDVFNLGAAAQTFVTSSATSSDYAKLELPNKDWEQTYASTEMGTLATYDNFVNNSSVGIYLGAAISSSLYLDIYVDNVDGDAADYDFEFSYYDEISKKTVNKTINLASTDASEAVYYPAYNGYSVTFRDVSVYANNSEITINVLKSGESIASGTYCLDAFIGANLNGPAGELLKLSAYLGESFRTFNGL